MKRSLLTIMLAVAMLAAFSGLAFADISDDRAPTARVSNEFAIVTFESPPAASYQGGIPGLERTKPERGRLDPDSPAYQAYVRFLEDNEHANYRAYLTQHAPNTEVVRVYDTVLNGMAVKLNGTSLSTLEKGPKVRAVANSVLYQPAMNVSRDLVRASEVWGQLGGEANAGSGIKVAIIDTGIDTTNRFFDDSAYPGTPQINECPEDDDIPNTNNKVIVCRVYTSGVAPGAVGGSLLAFDHGTHVAGTVAGNPNTSGTVAGTDVVISGLGGMAPKAWLGDYNVFPGFGAGFVAFGGSAFSHDIAQALEDAVSDGMHVANMSLGGGVQGPHDFLAEASDAVVDAGMVVAVAAGNSGPGSETIESPGSAAKVITAGASTNPHFVGIPVTFSSSGGDSATIGAALGDFNNFEPAEDFVDQPYTVTTPANGCTAISEDLTGQIALIDRGVCTFTTKVRNAEDAGAIGVLVANNVAGDPTAMAHDGTDPFPTIPAAMVGKNEGNSMKPSGTATIDGSAPQEFLTANQDIIAGFSSRGPVPFTFLIKPDVTGPGVNVLSSVFGDEFAFFQGTSMATPHVAGAAALILDGFPGASPAEVKSRLANSAARVVTDHVTGTVDPGVLARGGGRIDLVEAFNAATFFDPVSVSFGEIIGNRQVNASVIVDVTGSPVSAVSVITNNGDPGLVVTAEVDGNGDLLVSLEVSRTVPDGEYDGDVQVTAGGQTYLVPWWVRIVNR
ncbi:MAG: S8 family serine peptidase [Acidimicrobiia bacterium]